MKKKAGKISISLFQSMTVPHHNMQAERIMALTDAEARRAPNATVQYIEAKVKAKTNHTLDWLQCLPASEQAQAISFAIGHTRQQTKEKGGRKEKMTAEVISRMAASSRKRNLQERRKVEKRVRQLEVQKDVGKDTVSALSMTNDLSDEHIKHIVDLCQDPVSLVGANLIHMWYDQENESDEIFHGEIIKLRRRKKCTFVVAYHRISESPDDSEDYDTERTQIITDILYGDLVFVS